ncbi:MAG: Vps62-related protein [Planctomycetes bacterium]|nr:Vps62-related protein [Planctomycetota bacterium]
MTGLPVAVEAPRRPGPPRERRRRAWVWGLVLAAAAACLVRLHRGGDEPRVVPWEGPVPGDAEAVEEAAARAVAGVDGDGDGLDDGLEAEVARRHAPCFRFAGRDPAGPDSPQNRDEDYYPMSVARFLACLDAGVYRVRGVAVRAERPGRFEATHVSGFPSRLSGDPPGTAPVYAHVYPASAAGEAWCEYWLFYAHDRAGAEVLGRVTSRADHRGDWEHVAFRVALDPARVLEGHYYGHGRSTVLGPDEVERLEETHPVVYVSQGKHASYPAACWGPALPRVPGWLVRHHDVANGRGPAWEAWRGAVVDLGERGRPSRAAARWLAFQGRWGPDRIELGVLGLGAVRVGDSPTGPTAKSSWGRHEGGTPWPRFVRERGLRMLGQTRSP